MKFKFANTTHELAPKIGSSFWYEKLPKYLDMQYKPHQMLSNTTNIYKYNVLYDISYS